MNPRRSPLVGVLLVLALAAAVVEATRQRSDAAPPLEADLAALSPVASSGAAVAASWFCAGGSAVDGGPADHTVLITNPTDRPATGTISVFAVGEKGPRAEAPVAVAAGATQAVRLASLASAPWAAAAVELTVGEAVVTHELRGPAGADHSLCAARASTSWWFPWGQTTAGSTFWLALFNPFPDDAIVDITFALDDGGARKPTALAGLVVKGRSLAVVDAGEHAARRSLAAAQILARAGRLVAESIHTVDGPNGGLAATLGASQATTSWWFPDGQADAGAVERFLIFNPGPDSAEIDLELRPAGAAPGAEIEPFSRQIPPGRVEVIAINDEDRVTLPIAHATFVQSLNGAPVVVERVTTGAGAARGLTVSMGETLLASRSLAPIAAGAAAAPLELSLFNPSPDSPAAVEVHRLGPAGPGPLAAVEIPPFGRVVVAAPPEAAPAATALGLVADRPVVAAARAAPAGAPPDTATLRFVPAAGSVRRPPDLLDAGALGGAAPGATEELDGDLDADPDADAGPGVGP